MCAWPVQYAVRAVQVHPPKLLSLEELYRRAEEMGIDMDRYIDPALQLPTVAAAQRSAMGWVTFHILRFIFWVTFHNFRRCHHRGKRG
jgi:hypothetical protein